MGLISHEVPFLVTGDMYEGVDAARLLAIAEGRRVGGFVLGLPRNMDGSEGPRAQSTRAFARNLAGRVSVQAMAHLPEQLPVL